MTWHKNGTRYNPEKMVHPSDADAWKYFNSRHPLKAEEARNVRVVDAWIFDGFIKYACACDI